MTALWMMYVVVLGTLLAAAAAAADAGLRLAGRATRAVWAVAIAATLAIPAVAWIATTRSAAEPPLPSAASTSGDRSAALAALLARAEARAQATDGGVPWAALDQPLLLVWLAAAALGLAWLTISRQRLRALTRRWQPATVAGEPVLVAPDMGPAAVAEAGGRIVLPTWALALGDGDLTLMLAHERAHLEARDPQLLTAATVAVALAPWNPALWWQLRRLRLAVEIDCDRRVLRRHPDVGAYGALLLNVARRSSRGAPHLAAALSAPTPVTTLERRIRTMTSLRPRHAAARALGLTTLGVGLALAACETPHPTAVRPETRVPLQSVTNASAQVASRDGGPSLDVVKAALRAHAPDVASGKVRAQRLWFVQDVTGKIVRAAHDAGGGASAGDPAWTRELDASTIATIDVMKLAPGRLTPDSANVIWFTLRKIGAAGTPARGGDVGGEITGSHTIEGESRSRVVVRQTDATPATVLAPLDAERGPSVLKIRGSAAAPLYVVDGVELPAGEAGERALAALAPSSIARMDVLKGDRATAVYGARAANGVVSITTKQAATRNY